MITDERILQLIADFQERTMKAYDEGYIPCTTFLIGYTTDNESANVVWSVPDPPVGGGGSGREVVA